MRRTSEKSSAVTYNSFIPTTTNAGSITIISGDVPINSSIDQLSEQQVENAVYGHIQAVRALGRTTVSSKEVADSLALPAYMVIDALKNLRNKGVKKI